MENVLEIIKMFFILRTKMVLLTESFLGKQNWFFYSMFYVLFYVVLNLVMFGQTIQNL